MTESTASPTLARVHDRLRSILRAERGSLHVTADTAAGMKLEIPGLEGKPWGYVAGTRLGKRYVSYYLMGVYASPELVSGISPELRRRMQGKSCFNFSTVDETLLRELAALTARAVPRQTEMAESFRGGGGIPRGSRSARAR